MHSLQLEVQKSSINTQNAGNNNESKVQEVEMFGRKGEGRKARRNARRKAKVE
jgi:hypothetical protein